MMELKEGMYVRTKDGAIAKAEQIIDDEIHFDIKPIFSDGECLGYRWFYVKDVIKTSHNIIDLIEDGDIAVIEYYVSKYRQRITRMFECSLYESKEEEFIIFENKHCDWWYDKNKKEWVQAKGYNPKIKSIITKEQFESMSYKVKE